MGQVGGVGTGSKRSVSEVSRHRDDPERRRPGIGRGDGCAFEWDVVRWPEEHGLADPCRPWHYRAVRDGSDRPGEGVPRVWDDDRMRGAVGCSVCRRQQAVDGSCKPFRLGRVEKPRDGR